MRLLGRLLAFVTVIFEPLEVTDTGGDAGGDTGKGGYSGWRGRGKGCVTTWCHSCDLRIPDVDALAGRVVALAVGRDAWRDAPASFFSNPPSLSPPPSCAGAEGRGRAERAAVSLADTCGWCRLSA